MLRISAQEIHYEQADPLNGSSLCDRTHFLTLIAFFCSEKNEYWILNNIKRLVSSRKPESGLWKNAL